VVFQALSQNQVLLTLTGMGIAWFFGTYNYIVIYKFNHFVLTTGIALSVSKAEMLHRYRAIALPLLSTWRGE